MLNQIEDNPFKFLDDKGDPSLPTASLQIYKWINEVNTQRSNMVDRCSSATLCTKQRWFQYRNYEAKPSAPRKYINFMLGDLTEIALVHLIRSALVGPDKLYSEVDFGEVESSFTHKTFGVMNFYKQKDLSFTLPSGIKIVGHADGFGKRNSDGQWELIEVKSAANYGFKDFQTIGPKEYINQSHAVMMTDEATALNCRTVRFFYLRKETGHIYDRAFTFDHQIAQKVIADFERVHNDAPMLTPYEPLKLKDGSSNLQFPCTYCAYSQNCFNYTTEFSNAQFGFIKPTLKIKE